MRATAKKPYQVTVLFFGFPIHLSHSTEEIPLTNSPELHSHLLAIMAPTLEAEVTETPSDALSSNLKVRPKLEAPEPEHCPGPESEQAGQGDACVGCPNQKICATAPKGPDPDIPEITERLSGVKH